MDGQDNLKTAALFAVLDLQVKDFKTLRVVNLVALGSTREKGGKLLSTKGVENGKI